MLHPSPESELAAGVGAGAGGARTAPIHVKVVADAEEQRQSTEFLEECKQKVVAQGVKPHNVSTETLVAVVGASADVGESRRGVARAGRGVPAWLACGASGCSAAHRL